MVQNLINTMNMLSGKNRVGPSNEFTEVEKFFSIIFMVVYFLVSYFLHKISGLNLTITGILVASIFLLIAHQADKKFPLPNRHFWKLISFTFMFLVFLMMGV
jgi:NhaP-type Na+/H+ or K+/H+ antiporter